ncbi:MAG: hypothetical protein C0514_06080 [Candidatus Puniceispirillum sp.]|nr:hypothetical protein [Candidatus Puniceispirillum sp.]
MVQRALYFIVCCLVSVSVLSCDQEPTVLKRAHSFHEMPDEEEPVSKQPKYGALNGAPSKAFESFGHGSCDALALCYIRLAFLVPAPFAVSYLEEAMNCTQDPRLRLTCHLKLGDLGCRLPVQGEYLGS